MLLAVFSLFFSVFPCFPQFFPIFPCFPSSLSWLMVVPMLSVPAVSGIAGGRRKKEHP